ncbi:MAG: lysophospholipid acyltransferase family protein [Bacteroidetes bacterium]|nr:lysophospholipid acyltransferase family protein [Bacteroidota bacterium]MCY4225324.1 lysophospholipid acyltransferase family protein [Bacteroidota bacterium]
MRIWWRFILSFIVTIIGCILTSIGVWFQPKNERLPYRMMRQGVAARNVCRICNIHVSASRNVKLSPYTLRVSNHLTVFDPIILSSQMDASFAGKAEIARWPLIGWISQTYAMILVNRRRKGEAKTFASQVRQRLVQATSVVVFPEGTISDGITLLPFKTGAFESLIDFDQGKLQPIFISVTGVNGKNVGGQEGRTFLTLGTDGKLHHSFIRQVIHIAGFRRLDIQLCIGPDINISNMNRREIANVAREAILSLSEQVDA